MFEGSHNHNELTPQTPESSRLKELDTLIADTIESLEGSGLDMSRWNVMYENLPDDALAFEDFYSQLQSFTTMRQDALSSIDINPDLDSETVEKIRQFDRRVMSAFKDFDNYLGNGATAEVYGMRDNDVICVKFITDQERYNENNSIRVEYEYLCHVHEHVQGTNVKAPYPLFLRINAKEGHSYGMEKIQGASLSQILENPEKYPALVTQVANADRAVMQEDLLDFVAHMHNCGIVHCDLYKRNLMFDEQGRLFVIDFGKAKKEVFADERTDERKSDMYNARQSLNDFFAQLDALTISTDNV